MLQLPRLNRGLFEKLGLAGSADILNLYAARAARGFGDGFAAIILPAYLLEQFDADEMATYGLVHPLCWRGSTTGSVAPIYRCQEEKIAQRLEAMALRLLGHIELPAHRSNGGFDHADIHAPTDRLYVAHTSNDSIDVIDCARDRYIESIPDLTEVAGALVSETRGLVFTSNRGENTISAFAPSDERNAFKIAVGVKPNGLAFDPTRGLLIAANVGDPSIPDSYSVSVVDLGRRERTAEVKVPGRTRWAIYDATLEMFFVNIASPARIVAIDARDPTKISTEYEIPAAGPHGLDLDPAKGRLLCACDAGVLFAIEARSGRVLGDVPLSGAPDVIFLHPKSGHLYVAIGDPGVIDVIDIGTMRCKEVVPTEAGAHTLALDRKRSKVYSFLPQSHRAAIFVDTT